MIKLAIEEWGLYNAGVLACKWWDMDADYEEIKAFYTALRVKHGIYPADDLELFNADWECDTFDIINEATSFKDAQSHYEKIEGLEDHELKKLAYLTTQCGYDFNAALDNLDDCDLYEDMSLEDLAYDFVENGLFGEVPAHLTNYLDYDAIARDLGYDYVEYNGDIFRAA